MIHVVMPLADTDLLARLKKEPLEPAKFLRFAKDVACAIKYLHSRHIIHSDIKPENVLIFKDRALLVGSRGIDTFSLCSQSDFGLAVRLKEGQTETRSHFSGTAGYMAPEVVRSLFTGFVSDIYSFGVLLWQLVSR